MSRFRKVRDRNTEVSVKQKGVRGYPLFHWLPYRTMDDVDLWVVARAVGETPWETVSFECHKAGTGRVAGPLRRVIKDAKQEIVFWRVGESGEFSVELFLESQKAGRVQILLGTIQVVQDYKPILGVILLGAGAAGAGLLRIGQWIVGLLTSA